MAALMTIVNIIILLLILGVIIIIHELGHFFVAKLSGVLCHEFSIGMGPLMWRKKKKRKTETQFSIRWIPLGGYVAMAGEDDSDSYIKTGDFVGLNLTKNKYVKEIVLDTSKKCDIKGTVHAFNLYDDTKQLYITIRTQDGYLNRYYVKEDMFYILKKNKKYQNAPKSKSFEAKDKFPRFLVLVAGPMMNFLLALILFIFYFFLVGKPTNTNKIYDMTGGIKEQISPDVRKGDYLIKVGDYTLKEGEGFIDAQRYMQNNIASSYELTFKTKSGEVTKTFNPTITVVKVSINNKGYEESNVPIIGESLKDFKKQLKKGDIITKINDVEVLSWEDVINALEKIKDGDVTITVNRKVSEEETESINVTMKVISETVLKQQGVPSHLVSLGLSSKGKFNFFYSLENGVKSLWSNTRKTVDTLGALFSPRSGIGITDLSGPVGIFSLVKQTTQKSFAEVIWLIAFLSLNIGFINLLPIPALDGGRIMFLGIEALSGRRLNKKAERIINFVMFILLMGLMLFVVGMDIFKLIR